MDACGWPRRRGPPRCGPSARASGRSGDAVGHATSVIIGVLVSAGRRPCRRTDRGDGGAGAPGVGQAVEQLDDGHCRSRSRRRRSRACRGRHRRCRPRRGRRPARRCDAGDVEAEEAGDWWRSGVAEVGEVTIASERSWARKRSARMPIAVSWSTGTEEAVHLGAWSVIAITRWTLARASRSATRCRSSRRARRPLVRPGVGVGHGPHAVWTLAPRAASIISR